MLMTWHNNNCTEIIFVKDRPNKDSVNITSLVVSRPSIVSTAGGYSLERSQETFFQDDPADILGEEFEGVAMTTFLGGPKVSLQYIEHPTESSLAPTCHC